MDASNLGFADNSFDVGIATYALSAIPQNARAMSELERVVRPHGRIGMIDHNYNTPFDIIEGAVPLRLKRLLTRRRNSSITVQRRVKPRRVDFNWTNQSMYIMTVH